LAENYKNKNMEPTTPQAPLQPQVPQQPQTVDINTQAPQTQKSGSGQAIGIVIIILIIVLGGIYFWMMKSAKAPEIPEPIKSQETSETILNDLEVVADTYIEEDLQGIDNELK
jgi:uncharacterized protein HemX